jgi:hypothetical protein
MASRTITITFPPSPSHELVHQIRNFAEDLWADLGRSSAADVPDIDTLTNVVLVIPTSPRRKGEILSTTSRLLKKHFLLGLATIQVGIPKP